MAEIKISNTLVNDDSSQIIAYAEQIVDRVNYLNLKLNNPNLRVIVNALEVLKTKEDKENKLSNIIISNKEKETKQVKEEKIPEETKHEELDIKIDN